MYKVNGMESKLLLLSVIIYRSRFTVSQKNHTFFKFFRSISVYKYLLKNIENVINKPFSSFFRIRGEVIAQSFIYYVQCTQTATG